MKILALIPARSGSKGIVNKNLKKIKKKSLLSISIELAKKLKIFERVVVSTDSKKIADEAKKFLAEVPFIRPKKLSGGKSKMIDVCLHTINFFENKRIYFDALIVLQPTSPFRRKETILKCCKLLKKKNINSIISAAKCGNSHPNYVFKLEKGKIVNLMKKKVFNRQNFNTFYYRSGIFYAAKISFIKKTKSLYDENSELIIINNKEATNIDEEYDLWLAKKILN
tara:strand:- start:9497 stop:10171 length:675 start_codon:yes stop_codon:yes gene_type:complete